jgi:hypothetical protein
MSNVSGVKDVTQRQDVSAVIEAIGKIVKLYDCIALSEVEDPEVSGIVTVDGETFRDVVPLGDGVHIVLSVGDLSHALGAGIHEVDV